MTAAREAALTNEQVRFPLLIFIPLNCQDFLFLSFHISSVEIGHTQAMLEARMGVEELPSWVFFPDKERAEWVNTMLKQVLSQENILR